MHANDAQRPTLHDTLLDAHEVETTTKLSARTISRLVKRGLMPPPMKVGAQNRWSLRAIEAWMANGCGKAG